jgi:hypothetical protein
MTHRGLYILWGLYILLEIGVWLGIAGLALSSAHLLLWRTRRVLNRSQQNACVSEVPFAVTDSASSVIAS